MDKLLEARGLHFAYSGFSAVNGLDLAVDPGKILAVIGPNGSGKTTLMNMLAGLARPQRGEVLLKGRLLGEYSRRQAARVMAHMSQDTLGAPGFTALETVLMGRSPHLGLMGVPGREDVDKARRCMDRTGVGHLAARGLQSMSGGERQRVLLARALCQEPELLLLDEPATHMDMAGQIAVMDIVRDLAHESGLGAVAVVHDVNMAAMYADEILVMARGRKKAWGPPDAVLTAPVLEQAYGLRVRVERSSCGGFARIWPVPGHSPRRDD